MADEFKAITFDLWDTMIRDNSDEPVREARGLGTKAADRRRLLYKALRRHDDIAHESVATAYDVADAAFTKVWKEHYITWTLRERLNVLLAGLGRSLPEDELESVVAATEDMEIDVPPDAIEHIGAALEALSGRYKLCVISDTIVSPGRVLRRLLDHHGLLTYFKGFVFSDEAGCSKPDPRMFHLAAKQLGVDLTQMIHIGDRDHNDVKGPQALGMKAVLFSGVRDVDEATTSADAVCRDHRELPAIIDRLAGVAEASR